MSSTSTKTSAADEVAQSLGASILSQDNALLTLSASIEVLMAWLKRLEGRVEELEGRFK